MTAEKEIFIQRTENGKFSLFISETIVENIPFYTYNKLDEIFSLLSVWKVTLGTTHIGYEFSKTMCPETIRRAFLEITKDIIVNDKYLTCHYDIKDYVSLLEK